MLDIDAAAAGSWPFDARESRPDGGPQTVDRLPGSASA
jgi:hypothetical protein